MVESTTLDQPATINADAAAPVAALAAAPAAPVVSPNPSDNDGEVDADGPEVINGEDQNQTQNQDDLANNGGNANENGQNFNNQNQLQNNEAEAKAWFKKVALLAKGLNLPIKFHVLAGIAVLVVLVAAAACYFDNDSIARNLPWGAGAAVMGAAVMARDYLSAAGDQVLPRMAGISSRIQSFDLFGMVGTSSRVQTLEDKVAALEEEKLDMNTKFATMQGAMIISIARIHGAAKLQAHEHSTLKDQVDRAEAIVDGINALVQDEVQAKLKAIMNEWDV